MLAEILYNIEGRPENDGKTTFSDVKEGQWYSKAIAWAEKNKIVSGYNNELFGLGKNITREQMAAILYRYSKYKNYDTTVTLAEGGFEDFADVSDYAKEAVLWAKENGIITGFNNYLNPKGSALRSQAASIMARFAQKFIK